MGSPNISEQSDAKANNILLSNYFRSQEVISKLVIIHYKLETTKTDKYIF